MKYIIYKQENGDCPYLANRKWTTHFFYAEKMNPETYEQMMLQGWRRNSFVFYQNQCENCNECIPIRVDVDNFKPSKSQRRIMKKNQDVSIKSEITTFREEDLELFNRYSSKWHNTEEPMDRDSYLNFIYSPVPSMIMRYYLKENLIGIAWIDILKNSLSSVYFAFDPQYKERRLGTFSIIEEIKLCKKIRKKWLNLGFYVKDCQKMSYKANFTPYQLVIDGKWQNVKQEMKNEEC